MGLFLGLGEDFAVTSADLLDDCGESLGQQSAAWTLSPIGLIDNLGKGFPIDIDVVIKLLQVEPNDGRVLLVIGDSSPGAFDRLITPLPILGNVVLEKLKRVEISCRFVKVPAVAFRGSVFF